jgi:hypothetical protein
MRLKTNWRPVETETLPDLPGPELDATPLPEPGPLPPLAPAMLDLDKLTPRPPASPKLFAAPPNKVGSPAQASSPRQHVQLTKAEAEIARVSGISVEDYARGKLRLQAELRAGMRQNG